MFFLLKHLREHTRSGSSWHQQGAVQTLNSVCHVSPQVAKLSRSLQAEKIDLTAIAPLVNATLDMLDDARLPTANWILGLLDANDDLEAATDFKITTEIISSFQEQVAKPFVMMLKVKSRADLFHKMWFPHLASLIRRKCKLQTLQTCFTMGRTRWIYRSSEREFCTPS